MNANDEYGRQEQLLKLSGLLDMSCHLSIGCAGAVISYLARKRASSFLPGDENAENYHRITTVEMFSVQGSMFANSDTLASLQIIEQESHPNSHNQGPANSKGAKEGFSIYGLFHHLAGTAQGKLKLRQCFLRPSRDLDTINERLSAISAFLIPINLNDLEDLSKSLRSIKNIRSILSNLRKGSSGTAPRGQSAGVPIWTHLMSFAFHCLKIKDIIQVMQGLDHVAIAHKIRERFDGNSLALVGQAIACTIDFDNSKVMQRPVVKSGLDSDLDDLRRTYDGLDNWLVEVAKHIKATLPELYQEMSNPLDVGYYPRIGYVLQIEEDLAGALEAHFERIGRPWTHVFTAQGFACYKSPEMEEMDERFGDLWYNITDREIEIVHALAQDVLQHEATLSTISDIGGELDSLVALAIGAMRYDLVRPILTHDNIIAIQGGRHLLQELSVTSYVTNDTYIHAGPPRSGFAVESTPSSRASEIGPSVLIMTGPNYSGKSVYMKQVALIVYMAHVGCFVPAVSAKIGLTDKLLTRVATKESVSKLHSSFGIDLQQLSIALNQATSRSFLVLDELGKGTQPEGSKIELSCP